MDSARGSGRFSHEREEELHAMEADMQDAKDSECAVFVTDIARGVTDEMLREKFKSFGNVLEAFVVKNKFTGDTKGYGFVHFASMDEVYAALDAKELPRFEDSVNHKIQMVKVTMADPKDTLFIINIPSEWEEADVVRSLTEVGQEAPRKLRFSNSNKTTAYASYADHGQALRCLKNIQRPPTGVPAPVYTAYLAPPRYFDAKYSPSMKVLFVRGTSGISQDNLRKLFGGTDLVERVVIPIDSAKGGPIGHAFIHFITTKAAAEAKEALNGHEINGKRISVEWCLPKSVTHRRAPPTPPPASPYAYPSPYPPYPYYPETDPYYPPPHYPAYPYDPYGRASAHDFNDSHRDRRGPPSSDPFRGHYPPPAAYYPPPTAAYSPSSYYSKGGSYPPSPTHPSSSSRSPYPQYSQYPPSSDRGSRSSSYPPSSSSSYSSSRGSRYVPY